MDIYKREINVDRWSNAIRWSDKLDEDNFSLFKDVAGNFTFQKNFKDKRFKKYVSQVEKILYDFIKFYFNTGPCNQFDYIIASQLAGYYQAFSLQEMKKNVSDSADVEVTIGGFDKFNGVDAKKLFDYLTDNTGSIFGILLHDRKAELILETTEQLKEMVDYTHMLDEEEIKEKFGKDIISFNDILKHNTEAACARYIRDLYVQGKVTKGNYHEHLPTTHFDKMKILEDIVNDVVEDVNACFVYNYELQKDCINTKRESLLSQKDKEIMQLKEELNKAKTTIKEQEKILNDKGQQISKLEAETKKLNITIEKINNNVEIKSLQSRNKELTHEKEKIKKEYQHLKEKYDRLKTSGFYKAKEKTEIKPEQREEVDCTLNYLFVVDTAKSNCINSLKETFPNAVFHDTYSDIYNMNIDMVICLTGLVSHSLYQHFKRQCQSQNVAFIHCSCQNPDMVKDEIYKFFFE